MSNFGFLSLRLVNPYEVAYREARSAVGAGRLMKSAREFPSLAAAVADCSLVVGTASRGRRGLQHAFKRLELGAALIRTHAGPVALVFGSEKFGLSNDDMSHCHWLMRIPARDEHESMNLGQAVAVCLYELVRDAKAARAAPRAKTPARGADLERITESLIEILADSGYTKQKTAASTNLKVRRMIRRMGLHDQDAGIWLGMLRQIRWRLGKH
jgi:tRNA/rRNA methyltransferase